MQRHIYPLVLAALFVSCLCDAETHNITEPQPKCGGKEKASTLLDVAKDFMNKAKKLYPECADDILNCGRKEKSIAFLEVASNLISESKKAFPICPEPECPGTKFPEPECPETKCPETKCPEPECPEPERPDQQKPIDCSEILRNGKNVSGVYTIFPGKNVSSEKPLKVYCDMDTDGGGWTVIQRRGSFSKPEDLFFRGWPNYQSGFGDIKKEFWLGNENIHKISNQANTSIRFDLKDAAGVAGYAHYDTFWIENAMNGYSLHISGYSGNVGDAMSYNNGKKFSTWDRDNDEFKYGCATTRGAWWHHGCTYANLNGLNQPGVDSNKGITWTTWRKYVCLSAVEIKLRPRAASM